MKRFGSLLLLILFMLVFACQETKKKVVTVKKQPKKVEIIKRTLSLKPLDDVKDILKTNENFIKLYESFLPDSYSIDELIDLTKNDLDILKQLKMKRFKTKIDTAPVKSRLVLTEINIKKLNFLLHKKKIEPDTIRKTLDAITRDLNITLSKIKLYNQSVDEFEDILVKDSLVQAKKDSMTDDKKEVFNNLNKLKTPKIKKVIDFRVKNK